MAWIKYRHSGRSHVVKATLSTTGRLGFSDGARKRFGLDQSSHCVLYFDPDEKRIGVELVNDPAVEGAIPIRPRKTGCDVFARGFLEYFSITPDTTTSYSIDRDAQTGWLVIDLVGGRPRKSRTK